MFTGSASGVRPSMSRCFFVDHGSAAILDTGASKSVIGKKRLEQLMRNLPDVFVKRIAWQKSETVFRFGNNGTLASLGAVFIPLGRRWLRLEVVEGTTPFLLSNAFLQAVAADICTSRKLLCMFHGRVSVPLSVSEKGLFLVDLVEILKHAQVEDLHGESWEVVTNMIDERKTGKEETKDTHLCTRHTLPTPAATPASSTCEKPPISPDTDGAKESKSRLCRLRGIGCPTPIPRRSCSGDNAGPQRDQDCEAARSHNSEGVGRPSAGRRETRRKDICTSPGCRRELWRVHEEEGRPDLSVGIEFSELCESSGPGEPVAQDGTAPANSDSCHDRQDEAGMGNEWCRGHGLGCDRGVEGLAEFGSPIEDHDVSKWVSSDQAWASGRRQRVGHEGGDLSRGQPESGANSEADCSAAGRDEADFASRDGRCLEHTIEKLSSVVQQNSDGDEQPSEDTSFVQFFDMELANLVTKIEHQLEELANHSTDIRTRHTAQRFSNSRRRLDILEVYCFPDSQLTHTASKMGLTVQRFTLQLRTPEGQARLWDIIETQRPRHIWASPDCKLWGNFARRNMGRSLKLRKYVLEGRNHERPNLSLCEELYWHQVQTGNHFHLEQPVGSELLLQPELEQVRYRTLTTVFDMCEVGNLNWKGEPLRKRTIILTTSRQMHRSLDCRYCSKGHTHRQIAGQVKTDGVWIPFAAKYTASFAKAVIRVVQSNHDELPLLREELNISIEGNEVDQVLVGEAIKRRRMTSKQPLNAEPQMEETETEERPHKDSCSKRLKDLFGELAKLAPRVGSVVVGRDSSSFGVAQEFCDFQLKHAEICRGTERLRFQRREHP